VTPLEDVVLIVADDRAVVEADLALGRLLCPRCGVGVLGGWGCARLREVRTGAGVRRLRPRRGRCREGACGATHVLLPDVCLARRRYVAEVIGEALLSLGREGFRRVAERLGVPGETVREWRRRFCSRAELIAAHFVRWARALDASLDLPAGRGASSVGDALEAIGVCVRLASLVLARRPAWSWVSALTAGGLLSINTRSPWPAP
jgi:ribosomal protein S27AE